MTFHILARFAEYLNGRGAFKVLARRAAGLGPLIPARSASGPKVNANVSIGTLAQGSICRAGATFQLHYLTLRPFEEASAAERFIQYSS